MMIFRQSRLRPFIGVCGLWCVMSGVVVGQNSKGKNEADFAVPNPNGTYSAPNSGSLPNGSLFNNSNNNTYRSTGVTVSGQQAFDSNQPRYADLNQPRYAPQQGYANQPGYPSITPIPPAFPQNGFSVTYSQPPQEMLVYVEGEFKIATQNLGDPKTLEAFNEGRRVVGEAVQALRSESSSDESRADAKKVMTKYLEAYFDHDQSKRRQQLEALEAQVVKLKAQLEKRSQSKEQLIELRLTLLENDASGLAFPQSWTQVPGLEAGLMSLPGLPSPHSYPGMPYNGQFSSLAPGYSLAPGNNLPLGFTMPGPPNTQNPSIPNILKDNASPSAGLPATTTKPGSR